LHELGERRAEGLEPSARLVSFPIDGDGFFTHDRSVEELGTSPPAPSAG
jgi:hypothetical protein